MRWKIITKKWLEQRWADGKRITFNGKKYRVGKMSYGDYFLEPGTDRGETKPFNRGTKWLERVENKPAFYQVSHTF